MKMWRRTTSPRRRLQRPTLKFSPTAWAKFVYLRDCGPTEIGAFGITEPSEPLRITDVSLVPQTCTSVTVKFDDVGIADFFDAQIDLGRQPAEFARHWLHTHPGGSAVPSGTDEATFARVFGEADWPAMIILARGGATYARLRFRAGPGGQLRIPVEVDFGCEFAGSDRALWNEEYQRNVRQPPLNSRELPDVGAFASRWDGLAEGFIPDPDDPFYMPEDLL